MTATTPSTNNNANDEKPKGKRGGGPRVPEGMKRVVLMHPADEELIHFTVKRDDHSELNRLGDADDRDANGYARAVVRQHIRSKKEPVKQGTASAAAGPR